MRSHIRELSETIQGLNRIAEKTSDPAAKEGIELLASEVAALQLSIKSKEDDLAETLELFSDPIVRVEMRLRYFYGMSWKEIAVFVNRTERSASESVYKAMRKILHNK